MGWPTITGVLASITTKFGGDIAQNLAQLLSNVDIGITDATWKPLVNTDFRYRSGRLRVRDDQTPTPFEVSFNVANQSGARTIDIPVLTSGVNVPLFETVTGRLYNKTIDANDNNTFANIPVSVLSGNILKANLPAATVYTDQANTFGNYLQTIAKNYLQIANAGNTAYAKLGFLGTATHAYDVCAVDAESYLLAVSKTSIANGDLFYWSDGKLLRLGIGSTDQIIRVVGGIPAWSNETASAGLPSRAYFATDYANSSTLGTNRYQSVSGDSSTDTTLANRTAPLSNDIRVTKIIARVITNSLDQPMRLGIMDDGVMVAYLETTTGQTGSLSATVDVTIAAGSQIALVLSTTTASSGSYEVRPLIIEYEIGAPGAFGGTVVKEIGVQVGSVPRPLNFAIGTDFAITEDAVNNEIDIQIANDAIKTVHILDGNVTLAKLAADSVDASKIATGAVGNTELAADAVDAAKIATGAVGATELATDAVESAKIKARNVTEAKIELPLLNNIVKIPTRRDFGIFNGRNRTWGIGMLAELTAERTAAGDGISDNLGNYVGWDTPTTSNTKTGFHTTDAIAKGSLNPAFFFRGSFSVGSGTLVNNVRLFIGYSTDSSIPDSLDPLDTKTGFAFQIRSSNSDMRICSNNGGASDLQTATGYTPVEGAVISLYAYKVEGSNQWNWYIWTTNNGDINQTPAYSGNLSTPVPTGTSDMYFHAMGINKNSVVAYINRGYVAVSQDMI